MKSSDFGLGIECFAFFYDALKQFSHLMLFHHQVKIAGGSGDVSFSLKLLTGAEQEKK